MIADRCGAVSRDDDDLAGGAAAQEVDREAGGVGLRGLGARDGRQAEVAAELKIPGDSRSSASRALVEGICPRALMTAACMVPRPAVSCPAGPIPPVSPEASWPVPLVSCRPVSAGAGSELPQAAGELTAAARELADPGGELDVAGAKLAEPRLKL